jgi:solute carrier family 25 protein 33/36
MNPLWMVKTRFQIIADTSVGQRAFSSYRKVAQAIMREEGPPGFFKGITASYVGCFEGAIQWVAYEKLKTKLSTTLVVSEGCVEGVAVPRTPSPAEYFCAAAVSKFIAILATYPHETIRTRLREQATNGAFKYTGFVGTLKTIAREEGRR